MLVVTADEMRRLDDLTIRKFGVPGYELMRRAGRGAAEVLLDRIPEARKGCVVVVAGKGNNGGDGFVVASELRNDGVDAYVILLAPTDDVRDDAARTLADFRRHGGGVVSLPSEADVEELRKRLLQAAVVVDAIFGTGLKSAVEGRYARVIDVINEVGGSGTPVFAIDIPSGVDATTGAELGVAVRADATATFAFPKVGQLVHPGADFTGTLALVDIGIAAEAVAEVAPGLHWFERSDAADLVPVRRAETHKGDAGHVAILAGSRGRTGAARLAGRAALRTGAGLVTLAGPASLNAIFSQGSDELMTVPLSDDGGLVRFVPDEVCNLVDGKSAVVIGPGLGTHKDAVDLVCQVLREVSVPIVLDADALTCVAGDIGVLRDRVGGGPLVLTPHPGEMARLLGSDVATVQADRIGLARRFAAEHDCVLVLKGARTVVAAPDGRAWINPTGNPGMASGGMGDALTGILAALLAWGRGTKDSLAADEAARLGAFLHGDAADRVAASRGEVGMVATDVIEEIPPTIAALQAGIS